MGVPVLVLSFIVGLQWGVEGVAAGYCVANVIWVYPVIRVVLAQFDRGFVELIRVIYRPVLLSALMALLVAWVVSLGPLSGSAPIWQLVAGTLCGVAVYAALALLFMRASLMLPGKASTT